MLGPTWIEMNQLSRFTKPKLCVHKSNWISQTEPRLVRLVMSRKPIRENESDFPSQCHWITRQRHSKVLASSQVHRQHLTRCWDTASLSQNLATVHRHIRQRKVPIWKTTCGSSVVDTFHGCFYFSFSPVSVNHKTRVSDV